ncbi:MAG: L-threonylcarbamoyladenylate synthase [Patescibacteria group bacterium]
MKRLNSKTQSIGAIINQAKLVLAGGGLVVYPTETTYGLGVMATNTQAVAKLLKYKTRRQGKPLSIAVANQEMAQKYVQLNDQAKALYSSLLPGPVTVISKSLGKVAKGVASEFGNLGIRWSNYPLVTNLVQALGKPITATSANPSGQARPYSIDQLLKQLSAKQLTLIDLILDAGPLPKNPPSTVIDTTLSTPIVLRQGQTKLKTNHLLQTKSETETQELAGKIMLQHWDDLIQQGLIIGLDGALGTGKTVFAKGIAKFLGITQHITSPTYTYIHSYDFNRHGVKGQLHHIDVWKVDSSEMADKLKLKSLIRPRSILVIEWFDQVAKYLEPVIKNRKVKLTRVQISEKSKLNQEIDNSILINTHRWFALE